MDKALLEPLIVSIAEKCNLDPYLVLAIAHVETGMNDMLIRYEPNWNYLVRPDRYAKILGITVETEIALQRLSWGPLQCLGSNLRALGFSAMLTLAIQPSVSIMYACKYLQGLSKKYTNELDIISSYNQGTPVKLESGLYKNEIYVAKVVDQLNYLRTHGR